MQLVTGKLGEKKGAERGEEETGEGGSLTPKQGFLSPATPPPSPSPSENILFLFLFPPLESRGKQKKFVLLLTKGIIMRCFLTFP